MKATVNSHDHPYSSHAYFRVAAKVLSQPVARPTNLEQNGAESPARSWRLLVVDDDKVDRERVRRALVASGLEFNLDEIGSAEEGLDRFSSAVYDCILLDYHFPAGDALELFHDFISSPSRPPIVMLTGMGDERVAVSAIKCGVQEYLAKDELAPSNLRRAIEGAIQDADLQRHLVQQTLELLRLSLYDDLTGLPNRTLFLEKLNAKLNQHSRSGGPFAVLVMDLDGFKEINGRLGHQCGDEVLKIVSDRLARKVRQSDSVARLGGDEFAAILEFDGGNEGARQVAEKLVETTHASMPVGGLQLTVGLSVGIAIYPHDGMESAKLICAADAAMYEAKRGQLGFCLSGHASEPNRKRQHRVVSDLQGHLDLNRFVVQFQPQLALATGEIVGVEALVRWNHHGFGMLPPGDFIAAAERTKAIRSITGHVIRQSLAQTLKWRAVGLQLPVSVNLSPCLLDDPSLADEIVAYISDNGIVPGLLTIELTESGFTESTQWALKTTETLADAGVRLSIDDFGTGTSSLTRLEEYPIAEIKIDRSFVSRPVLDCRGRSIVRSVVDLGRELGMRVVAEGIEDDHVWKTLAEMGCEFGQGFRFSQPLDAADVGPWCTRWTKQQAIANSPG